MNIMLNKAAGMLVLVTFTAVLSACNNASHPSATPPPEPATAPAAAPRIVSIDAPLVKAEVGARVTQVGTLKYDAVSEQLLARFKVENTGAVPLITAGKFPVKLGIQLIGEDGNPDKAPGKREFGRVNLPLIAPGESAEVEARIPAKPALGLRLRVLPLQEGAAWFDNLGQKALVVGPIETCADGTINICGK